MGFSHKTRNLWELLSMSVRYLIIMILSLGILLISSKIGQLGKARYNPKSINTGLSHKRGLLFPIEGTKSAKLRIIINGKLKALRSKLQQRQ